jgi:hypothetical protein
LSTGAAAWASSRPADTGDPSPSPSEVGPLTSPHPNHPTERLQHPAGIEIEIDQKLVPLISSCWLAGIDTAECCQEQYDGDTRISFASRDEIDQFVRLIFPFDDVVVSYPLDRSWPPSVTFPADYLDVVTQLAEANAPLLVYPEEQQGEEEGRGG